MTRTLEHPRAHLSHREAVQNGIQLLDREEPGWRNQINLDTLDVSSCTHCILGQIYGHYATGEDRLEIHAFVDRLGFSTIDGYDDLTDEWKLALAT